MWQTQFVTLTFAGFFSGLIFGILFNEGLFNPGLSLFWGIVGACSCGLVCYFGYLDRTARTKERQPRPTREESEGSFSDRLERFSKSVEHDTKAHAAQAKMSLWMSEDCEDLDPMPPKSVGIIRMLLKRIRKV